MTAIRRDIIMVSGSMYEPVDPFMLHIRERKELDSFNGFRCYDIDGFLWQKKTGNALIVEHKSFNSWPKADQLTSLEMIHRTNKVSKEYNYVGTLIIQSERINPYEGTNKISSFNGRIWEKYPQELSGDEVYQMIGWLLTKNP